MPSTHAGRRRKIGEWVGRLVLFGVVGGGSESGIHRAFEVSLCQLFRHVYSEHLHYAQNTSVPSWARQKSGCLAKEYCEYCSFKDLFAKNWLLFNVREPPSTQPFGKYYLSHLLLYSSAFMVSNRRMQWESLFGFREIYHPDIGKLDDCPHSIKPKYSIVLNTRDSDWMCSGKLSKEWNGGGCVLSSMRLTEESTDLLLESISAEMCVSFTIRSRCSSRVIWSYSVFLSSFQFQESGMFQNIEWKQTNKKHGGHKSIWLCGSIWTELLFGEREEPLMSPIWFS